MKKLFLVALMIILASALILAGCAKPAPAPKPVPAPAPAPAPKPAPPTAIPADLTPVTLVFSSSQPQTMSRQANVNIPWFAELEKRTEGKVKVEPHFAASLSGGVQGFYDSVVKGIADIADAYVTWTPGRFSLSEVTYFSRVDQISDKPANIMMQLYKEFPEVQAQYSQTKLLYMSCDAFGGFNTVKKLPLTPEGLKGLKMYTTGKVGVAKAKAVGWSPITMEVSDVYMSLQTGVIDGYMGHSPTSLTGRKFGEVAKHYVILNWGTPAFCMVMNMETWNKLHPAIQKIIDDMCGDFLLKLLEKEGWHTTVIEPMEVSAKQWGVEFLGAPPETMAKFEKAVDPVTEEYIAEYEAKGLPARKVVERYRQLLDKYVATDFLKKYGLK